MNFKEEVERFKREQCKDCKSNMCHIVINIEGKAQCVYRETNKEESK